MQGVNLLPWRDSLRKQRKKIFYLILGASIFISISTILLLHYWIHLQIRRQEIISLSLENRIDKMSKKIISIEKIISQKNLLLNHLDFFHQLQHSRIITTRLVSEMSKIIPENIMLQTLNREKDNVIIQGSAKSNQAIYQLIQKIQNSMLFGSPILNRILKKKDSMYQKQFKITFKVILNG